MQNVIKVAMKNVLNVKKNVPILAYIEIYVKSFVMRYVILEDAMKNVPKNLKNVNINALDYVERDVRLSVKNVI